MFDVALALFMNAMWKWTDEEFLNVLQDVRKSEEVKASQKIMTMQLGLPTRDKPAKTRSNPRRNQD